MKKLGLFVMAVAALMMVGCKPDNSLTALKLNPTTLKLVVGETSTIRATKTPSNAEVTIEWTSSNTKVATVAKGVVTAVAAGKAEIVASVGDITATCSVTVTEEDDARYALNLTNYGLFGQFTPVTPARDTTLTFGEGKNYKCSLKYVDNVYAWDENIIFMEGVGLVGQGWVCCFQKLPVWVIEEGPMKGSWVNFGGFGAANFADGRVEPYYATAGQLDAESYGNFVQQMYNPTDSSTTIETLIADMQKKTYGAFISVNQYNDDEDSYTNYYHLGLYDAHINRFFYLQEDEDAEAQFAAEVTWGNLDSKKYWYGFEYTLDGDGYLVLTKPYKDHYKTITKIYDDYELFSGSNVQRHYTVGNPALYHKEGMPKANCVIDRTKLAKNF